MSINNDPSSILSMAIVAAPDQKALKDIYWNTRELLTSQLEKLKHEHDELTGCRIKRNRPDYYEKRMRLRNKIWELEEQIQQLGHLKRSADRRLIRKPLHQYDGTKCIECENDSFEVGPFIEESPNRICRYVQCDHCDAEWYETFELKSIIPTD